MREINMKILLLEDEQSLREGIAFKLGREGYSVDCAQDVAGALALNLADYDLAILDVGLPDGSGLSVCKAIRARNKNAYILFLTAQDTEIDAVNGYESGGDDYVLKPFSLSILMAKIAAVARRVGDQDGDLRLDPARQCAFKRGETIELSRNEYRLLNMLLQHAGQILTRDQLLLAVFDIDGDFVDENTLAVNIRRLREKIEDDPSRPSRILNVRGVGYKLVTCDEDI